jgi:transcriptional regulator GlxA family with amidase domain
MQIAILLFDNMTALDAIGPYEVLSRLPGARTIFVGERLGTVRTDTGALKLVADAKLDEVLHPDVVVVPGGPGQLAHMDDGPVHDWLRTVDAASTWTTSVCTGSLILAAAGLLAGRRATTHWLAADQLPDYGVTPDTGRIVFDGKYATAAGVSAGIDMGLALAGRLAGEDKARTIQLGIEYDPQPPYNAGSPATASPGTVAFLRANPQLVLGTQQQPA